MSLFGKKVGINLTDVIRCDEPDYLIWKWRPDGRRLGESRRENSIRWGSSLRVRDGEVAVFVYKRDDGSNQDYIVGPADVTLKTDNLPVLSSIIGFAYAGGTPFQAEVYFINLARIIQVKFGVPYFDVYDPRFEDFGVPVAVRGTISFRIGNCCEFVRLHRLTDFSVEDFQRQIKEATARYVKDIVANAPAAHGIPVVQLESKLSEINDTIEYDLKQRLSEDFGVIVSGVDIGAIEIDKSSEGYRQLMAVTKDLSTSTAKAEAEAKVRNIADRQEADAEHYRETLRIQREEAQYAQHKQTQTANIAAYQVETQAEVGIASAQALGRMGENSAGHISVCGGIGIDPVGMAAGIAVGEAVGKNIAKVLNGKLSDTDRVIMAPPPVPTASYYVAVNEKAAGPYEISTLKEMAASGILQGSTLVWKQGMSDWARADMVDEINKLPGLNIPPIPTEK